MNSDNPLHQPMPIPEAIYEHLTGTLHYPAKFDGATRLVTVPGHIYGSIRRKKAKARKPGRLPRSARKGASRV